MRILYITPVAPALNTGGGRLAYANLAAISALPGVRIDFVGPSFDAQAPMLRAEAFDRVLSRSFTLKDRLQACLSGNASGLYGLFREWRKSTRASDYDLVFVESTRCGFVFGKLPGKQRVVVMAHNVERDYMRHNQKGMGQIANVFVPTSERKSLRAADAILTLHGNDKERFARVYGGWIRKHAVCHPVCSFPPSLPLIPWKDRRKIALFIGSLDQRYNEQGIMAFIRTCLGSVTSKDYRLVVSGRNPSPLLRNFLCNFPSVTLVPNPGDAEAVVRSARVLVLPDLIGTGMKLRVAEAMSLGVPIVGTKLGLLGYGQIERYGVATETIPDMAGALDRVLGGADSASILAQNARREWTAQYSYDVFQKRLHSILTTSHEA